MSFGHSGKSANLGNSERRKGHWTRCTEALRLCWLEQLMPSELGERMDLPRTNVSLILTKLRKAGFVVDRHSCTRLTDAGRAECERLWPQRKTG
jgi:DNA-binding MarR family transcriptional regulator